MKKLQILINRFQALSDEDKRKALLVSASVALICLCLVVFGAASSLRDRHSEIKRLSAEINQVGLLSAEYYLIKAEQEHRKNRFRTNNTALFTLIQNVATRLNLTLNDLNERKEQLKGSALTEISVVVTVKQLSLDRLHALLENIEDSTPDGLVKVTRLQVKTRFDQPDLLDVQMTISTWKAS